MANGKPSCLFFKREKDDEGRPFWTRANAEYNLAVFLLPGHTLVLNGHHGLVDNNGITIFNHTELKSTTFTGGEGATPDTAIVVQNQPIPGAGIVGRGLSVGQAESLQERLTSPLPDVHSSAVSTVSSTVETKYWRPSTVETWKYVIPDNQHSGLLSDAIITFQTEPHFSKTPVPKFPSSLTLTVGNEGEVRVAWGIVLSTKCVPLPPTATWSFESTDKIIQGMDDMLATLHPLPAGPPEIQAQTANQRQDVVLSVSLPADSMEGGQPSTSAGTAPPAKRRRQADSMEGGQPSTSAGTAAPPAKRRQQAGSVEVGQPSSSAGTDAPPAKRRAVCLGELKARKKLDLVDPPGLVSLCNTVARQGTQDRLPLAVSAVHQLYTYMANNCVLFGFLSCWDYTYLARLVPKQREKRPWTGRFFLSPVILSTARHTPQQPQITAVGGVSWLQHQALELGSTLSLPREWRVPSPPCPSSPGSDAVRSPPSSGTPSGHSDDSKDPDYVPDKPSDLPSTNRSGGVHSRSWSQLLGGADGVVSVELKQQPVTDVKQLESSLMPPRVLHLEQRVCDGCYGAVFRGTCDEEAAVIKLLGPSSEGMAAFYRERDMLSYLAAANVQAASRLLGVGRLHLGIHFIATALVEGQPLSRVQPLTQEVGAAAQRALAQVHAAHPHLLHGDIRLENILLVTSPLQRSAAAAAASGSNGEGVVSALPECKIIDFGASSFDGSPAGQALEMHELQKLLQQASETAQ